MFEYILKRSYLDSLVLNDLISSNYYREIQNNIKYFKKKKGVNGYFLIITTPIIAIAPMKAAAIGIILFD